MKKNILLIILLLVFSNLYAGTVYYANSSRPDNTGNGLSWATAKKTLDAFDAILASHDTVVCKGTFGAWTPETGYRGYGGNYTVFIDSFRYVNGFKISNPDTVWSATILNGAITFQTADRGIKLIGFYLSNNASWSIFFNSGCDDNWLIQCKFNCLAADPPIYISYADSIRIVSCLFIGSTNNQYGAIRSSYGVFINIINCTFYGALGGLAYPIWFNISGTQYKSVFVNNLIINTYPIAIYAKHISAQNGISDWNNNIYYSRKSGSSPTDCWYIGANNYSTLATWRTALQAYDADGETNSLYLNPGVRDTLTTCYITKSSPAYNAGRNMGYGTSIGYYQNADYGVYYVNSSKANDNGNGYSWATAKQTISSLKSQIGAGDTVVCKGTWLTTALNISGNTYPDGLSNYYVVLIDSLRYTDGYDEEKPDTVYSAKIYSTVSGNAITVNKFYYKVLGFYLYAQTSSAGAVQLGDDGDYAIIQNCKLNGVRVSTNAYGTYCVTGNQYSRLISCLVICDRGYGIYSTDDYNRFYNCTIIKSGILNVSNSTVYFHDYYNQPIYFQNNIIYMPDETNDLQVLVNYPASASVVEFDYNLYHAPNKVTKLFKFNFVDKDNFVDWVTSMHGELGTAEDHSSYSNPLFLETNNYAIDATSPAFGTGTDLGYGTNIGYYQGSGTVVKKGFKSRVIIN